MLFDVLTQSVVKIQIRWKLYMQNLCRCMEPVAVANDLTLERRSPFHYSTGRGIAGVRRIQRVYSGGGERTIAWYPGAQRWRSVSKPHQNPLPLFSRAPVITSHGHVTLFKRYRFENKLFRSIRFHSDYYNDVIVAACDGDVVIL